MIDLDRAGNPKGIDWADAHRRLTGYVKHRMRGGSVADQEDMVQQVFAEAKAKEYAGWDRDVEPDVVPYFRRLANGLIANWRKSKRRRGEHVPEDDVRLTGADYSPETAVYLRQLLELFSAHILDHFGKKGLKYFRIACDSRADQARELGMTDMEVTRLKRKILEFCVRLREEHGLPAGDGMYHRYPPMSEELCELKDELAAVFPDVKKEASSLERKRDRAATGMVVWLALIVLLVVLYLSYVVWGPLFGV
jgi:hypothetical protein